MLFDYSIAFASVSHRWLFQVLRSCRAPIGFYKFVKNRYSNCNACLLQECCVEFLCNVKSGVFQGRPLRSVLFFMCNDPLLYMVSTTVGVAPLGHVFACADDIAITLRHLEQLKTISSLFNFFAEVSGICIKPAKCGLILLAAFASPIVLEQVRQ